MGSTIRVNDTLQITREQGFPAQLDIDRHLDSPLVASHFDSALFAFHGKEGIRNFQQPPVRNFLVENRAGKHIYWGLITMVTITHDYFENVTAGEFKIYTIYTPRQMKMAAQMIGLADALDYFGDAGNR